MSNQTISTASGNDPLACCTPLGRKAMAPEEAEAVASMLKALADPVRLRLMSLIAGADEACVCELTAPFELAQPTISHHLRVLREAGLVRSERRGTWVYYRARREALDAIGGLFALERVSV
jgi:ArsR family transcriptional regulator, arsenate/arsenite/antimonite-responsive transcriptional repressor